MNIVKLYSYLSSLDSSLLVYEYLQNGNLWDTLDSDNCPLDWPARRRIALGVARGLAYLHHDLARPIIHRDIKSKNILLDGSFQPKIGDFGTAIVLEAGEVSIVTGVAGTSGYIAPGRHPYKLLSYFV